MPKAVPKPTRMDLVTPLILSIALGNLLAVMAAGVSLTYAVMGFSNFAHGELVTIGAYASYLFYYLLGQPFYVTIVPAFIIGALTALVLHLIMFKPLTKRRASLITLLVGSIGVSFAYKYALYILTDLQGVWTFVPGGRIGVPASGGPQPVTIGNLFGVPISDFFIYSLVAAVGMAAFLSYYLYFTSSGRFSRALAENPELAEAVGIPTEKIRLISWVLIGGFAAIGGALLGPSNIFGGLSPETGFTVLFYVFAASILGGRIDFYSTFVSAYIVGFASTYGIQLASAYLGIPSSMQPVVPFAIMVATLLLRPEGISGISSLSWRRRASSKVS